LSLSRDSTGRESCLIKILQLEGLTKQSKKNWRKQKKMSALDAKDKELETLRQKCEMLDNRNRLLEGQLKEATDAFKDITAKARIEEEATRKDLVETISRESEGKLAIDMLEKMTLPELYVAKTTLDKTRTRSFASIIAAQDAEAAKPKIQPLTVGQWDSTKKQWIGGM
jgi:hypothetical protein